MKRHFRGGARNPWARSSQRGPASGTETIHCAILATDIAGFGRRDDEVQQHVRGALYAIMKRALRRSRVAWSGCYREDRGDGFLLIPPAAVPPVTLVDPMLHFLRAGLRRHNKLHSEAASIQLRVALHTGQIRFDPHGMSGATVVHVCRLLEAPIMKQALAAFRADLAFIASEDVFDTHLRQGPELVDPATYYPVDVAVKETAARAWLHIPAVTAATALVSRPWPRFASPFAAEDGARGQPQRNRPLPPVSLPELLRRSGIRGLEAGR